MKEPFDLDWLGGPTERAFRKLRPGVDALPWGTLDPAAFPPVLVERARTSWTEASWNEYCTAAGFTVLLKAMLEAHVPLDLIGMASDFVVDEVLHAELTARLAMELGGSDGRQVDFTRLTLPSTPGLTPLQLANEEMVRLCCVSEAFSVPVLRACERTAAHPLTQGVLRQIVADEVPHALLGRYYLEWVADRLDDAERARLGQIALDTLRTLAPFWTQLTSRVVDGVTTEGFAIEHVYALGWADAETYRETAIRAVRDDILAPLAFVGIHPDPVAVEALLA
ncbi:MAG: hypothetical protein R3F61_20135 [Myxococcota bacterium]